MSKSYSVYEVKARFSELLRAVREGKTITVTYRGEPVAEIKPLRDKDTLEQRLKQLEERGVLIRATGKGDYRPVAKRKGALRRFLEERGD